MPLVSSPDGIQFKTDFRRVIIGLLCDPQLSAHKLDTLALGQVNFCLPKHSDDLPHSKTPALHPDLLQAPDPALTLTQNLDQFLGVRSREPGFSLFGWEDRSM